MTRLVAAPTGIGHVMLGHLVDMVEGGRLQILEDSPRWKSVAVIGVPVSETPG